MKNWLIRFPLFPLSLSRCVYLFGLMRFSENFQFVPNGKCLFRADDEVGNLLFLFACRVNKSMCNQFKSNPEHFKLNHRGRLEIKRGKFYEDRCQRIFRWFWREKWDIWVDLFKFIGMMLMKKSWRLSERSWVCVCERGKSKRRKCGTPIVSAWTVATAAIPSPKIVGNHNNGQMLNFQWQGYMRTAYTHYYVIRYKQNRKKRKHTPSRERESSSISRALSALNEVQAKSERCVCVCAMRVHILWWLMVWVCSWKRERERERLPENRLTARSNGCCCWCMVYPDFFFTSVRLTDAFARVCVWYLLSSWSLSLRCIIKCLGNKWSELSNILFNSNGSSSNVTSHHWQNVYV